MKYRLIASDIDGTLLNRESALTPRTTAALRSAVEAGVLFVAATGRAPRGVGFLGELFDKDMPFIVLNGASAVMSKSHKVLFNKYLGFALAKEAYEIGLSRGAPMIIWTDRRLWVSSTHETTEAYRRHYGMELNLVGDFEELRDENIYKVFWVDDAERTRLYQAEMNERFGGKLNCHTSMPQYLEFVCSEAGKGAALEEVGRLYGIDRSEMIAVGDGYNDISMLKYAGLSAAVANAPDDVKAACNLVTRSNDEDGVAVIIEEYIL